MVVDNFRYWIKLFYLFSDYFPIMEKICQQHWGTNSGEMNNANIGGWGTSKNKIKCLSNILVLFQHCLIIFENADIKV